MTLHGFHWDSHEEYRKRMMREAENFRLARIAQQNRPPRRWLQRFDLRLVGRGLWRWRSTGLSVGYRSNA